MFGLIWIPWILVVALLLFTHHVAWWAYVVVGITVCVNYPVGNMRAVAQVAGWGRVETGAPWYRWYSYASLVWLLVAAAIFYQTHLAWWVYLILASAVWIGGSMGYVAKTTEIEHISRSVGEKP